MKPVRIIVLAVAALAVLCVLTASAYGAHRVLDRNDKHRRAVDLFAFAKNPAWFKAELERVLLQ